MGVVKSGEGGHVYPAHAVQELRAAIKVQSNIFFKKNNDYIQIKNIKEVNITNNFYGPVEKVINTENFFEDNKFSEDQKIKISDELIKLKGEPDKEKKESKLNKFIQEWGGTITDLGMTMIKKVIE
ncbi:MAG: hypothetical protein KAS32_24695 [Candidatus Peribacteraceae bacterium]|nr:hypothetical protein [Candidatus Peribacteraceae bacterium]